MFFNLYFVLQLSRNKLYLSCFPVFSFPCSHSLVNTPPWNPDLAQFSYFCNSHIGLPSGTFDHLHSQSFPGGSDSKESACNVGDQGSVPGSKRSPGKGNSYLFQYSCLENSTDTQTQTQTHTHTHTCYASSFSTIKLPNSNLSLPLGSCLFFFVFCFFVFFDICFSCRDLQYAYLRS